jgi:hypothetical protein
MAPSGSAEPLRVRPPELSESGGTLRLALLVAAVAAILVALDLFSTAVRVACLAVLAAVLGITAGERRRLGSGWWDLVAAGTVLSIAGALLAQAAATAGGIIAIAGAALVLVGATIGFPPGE